MPAAPPPQLGLSITNPLVLYRTLVATKKIKPDPAQHRLALQLQKLYFRLKDYAPEIEYRYRLERIGRNVQRRSVSASTTETKGRARRDGTQQQRGGTAEKDDPADGDNDDGAKGARGPGLFSSLLSLRSSLPSTTLALTRTTQLHHSALSIDSPMGMLLYGEVGRGKSMLLDLLYQTLPSRQKRRWHFNTFMLDVFRRIEVARIERLEAIRPSSTTRSLFSGRDDVVSDHEHVMLSLAKDTVCDSPILFLDEFQMPDRAASKLVNGFFTAFFHLGGVLVASSNRMPEELSKAAGIEFGDLRRRTNDAGRGGGGGGGPVVGGFFGLGWGMSRESEGERAAKTDFGLFLDVLRARCEVWEMEGEKDWRREGDDDDLTVHEAPLDPESSQEVDSLDDMDNNNNDANPDASLASRRTSISSITSLTESTTTLSSDTPAHYHITLPSSSSSSESDASFETDLHLLNPSSTWTPTTLTIYGRRLDLPSTHRGVLKSTFAALCATYLGPADYVSLCSTFHTLVLTDVPVLTLAQKNEARRFITLLDALYEARCRLLIRAAAPPDKLFFPETRVRRAGTMRAPAASSSSSSAAPPHGDSDDDRLLDSSSEASITSESFSEMYQDSTAPFRPNISSYTAANTHSSTPAPSFSTPSLHNPRVVRSVLADEDADFGPTYGNGRGHGVSDSAPARWNVGAPAAAAAPDFTSTSVLTGEDERFAYKRARSRLWEMCGRRWWAERLPVARRGYGVGVGGDCDPGENGARGVVDTAAAEEDDEQAVSAWWRPVHRSGRFWEPGAAVSSNDGTDTGTTQPSSGTTTTTARGNQKRQDSTPSLTPGPGTDSASRAKTIVPTGPADADADADPKRAAMFRHDASPYRTHADPPPKFGWQHAWGMMRWGKKAGGMGQGRRRGQEEEGGEGPRARRR
ncbi:hypothetical protein AYL99_11515 [Fonsecaea erecta]|uniref:AAA+ ATPase domain-containing protein n=1 Tax=Fonsecaea erecta TaxID=1367422 RepID=A0A178Z3U9_9EURO|nr:hypothetical protein AYL99_11515 [Fonsecaea erecta]OAP54414.1 hypothetical protein AYL99_11515 [Fonsecaea erecta]